MGTTLEVLPLLLLASAGPADLNSLSQAEAISETAGGARALGDADLLLIAVELDHATLAEAIAGHGDPADPLLPVGEMARLLELDIAVSLDDQRITGTIGTGHLPLFVDLARGRGRIGTREITFGREKAGVTPVDLFLAASVIEKLLPLKLAVNSDDARIVLSATEQLPVQARKDRLARSSTAQLQDGTSPQVRKVPVPYRLAGMPAFDFIGELAGSNDGRELTRRVEARIAADFLATDFTGYLGTDEFGQPSAARVRFERRAPDNDLFGQLGGSYAAIGDVFTPMMLLGPRSTAGMGITFSSAREQDTSVFDNVSLRGELPLGYDVELYVNDVLRGSQRAASQGRYEFIDIPLVRGMNVIRIVTYGPRGEREEVTRAINVGSGQLAPGQTSFDFGAVARRRAVFEFRRNAVGQTDVAHGSPDVVVTLAHGLTSSTTVSTGFSLFKDEAGVRHNMATIGFRSSVLGAAIQSDLAHDFGGGTALSLGLASRIAGASILARHIEYRHNFVDENNLYFDLRRPMIRYSEVAIDFTVPLPGHQRLPVSGNVQHSSYLDGGDSWSMRGRTTILVDRTLWAIGLDYTSRRAAGMSSRQLSGNISGSRSFGHGWQFRLSGDYSLLPNSRLNALAMTVDKNFSDLMGGRLGMTKTFGDNRSLGLQAGTFAHLRFAEAALLGDYATDRKRWQIGLQLSFGFAFDPFRRRYALTRPGPASGATVAFQSFVDLNNNGLLDTGEQPAAGLMLEAGGLRARTDSNGRALLTGLGEGASGLLRVDLGDSDMPFVTTPPQTLSFQRRPGGIVKVNYPLIPSTEVDVRLEFRTREGRMVGLSSVRLHLISEHGEDIEVMTEYDGTAVFEAVKPGRYTVTLDDAQAGKLGLYLISPLAVDVQGGEGRVVLSSEVKRREGRDL